MEHKYKIFLVLIFFQINCYAQADNIEEFGFRKYSFEYKEELVNVLIQSKKGEENVKKPLIVYFQGSLARPLIINYPTNNNYKYSLAFPFNTEKIIEKYHLAVISKPFIPLIADINQLDKSYSYIDSTTSKTPIAFLKNDNLKYMTKRNIKAVNFFKKQKFVDSSNIILLGHSEGSRIAFEVTKRCNAISHLIYLSGNPFGRYMNITQRIRKSQNTESVLEKDDAFDYWIKILENKNVNNYEDGGDSYNSWFVYAKPYYNKFLKIKKPVFIGYGTKDDVSPFNDLFYFYVLLNERENFFVKAYLGLEHSFFEVKDDVINHDVSYFDIVIDDILVWLEKEKN